MSEARYVVGIDLGTTNCVLAYCRLGEDGSPEAEIEAFSIPQLVAPSELGESALLPSFIYLPTKPERESKQLALPWDPFGERVVGAYAWSRGAEVPGRLVASAKSWLCHQGVDRTASLLPLDAPEDCPKISPIVATATFLRHLKAAWNQSIGREEGCRLEEQEIHVTIPASFDAVARELTVQAARSAGLEQVTLLEEPQAAFYSWLDANQENWRKEVCEGDVVLVFDVGGGTTDFSLIEVASEAGELTLERIAVGDHLLLGGDNMDLALAYALAEDLAARGERLDALQVQTLWHNVRLAKERLLADRSLPEVPVVIPGRGTGLVAGTIRTALSRAQVESLLLEGFLPTCGAREWPEERVRIGLQEIGLPYARDTAITRHLARFLGQHPQPDERQDLCRPTAVLFNGGVLKARLIRERIMETLNGWLAAREGASLRQLSSENLDLAVARGAAYYGLVRRGVGLRIRGGIGRSYYIGIEIARPAVPGLPPPVKALCVVPQGLEEGSSVTLPDRTFGLVVGQPVEFRFLASTTRPQDQVGALIEDWSETIEEITTLQTAMEAPEVEPGTILPVRLEAKVTEVGTLALSLVPRERDLRFDLEFNVRG